MSQPELRERAVMQLPRWAAQGQDIMEPLILALKDQHPLVGRAAAIVAGRLRADNPQILDTLVDLLGSARGIFRRTVVTALSRCGEQALPLMIPLLADRDPYIRHFARIYLRETGLPVVSHLLAALDDKRLRYEVADVLVYIGTPVLPKILLLFDDPRETIRNLAVEIMVNIGSPAVPMLIKAFQSETARSALAAEALGQLGWAAIPALTKVMAEESVAIRTRAAELLGRIGRMAIPSLMGGLCSENPSMTWVASKQLVMLGEIAVPELIRSMAELEGTRRWIIADVLKQIGEPAVQHLERTAELSDDSLRVAAIHALGRMGETGWSALPTLKRLLVAEQDAGMQAALKEAVQRLDVYD